MGIINEIFANGWEDVDFLCDHTEAALLIKEDGSLLKMSDLGVEAAKGEPDPTTGEPTIIDLMSFGTRMLTRRSCSTRRKSPL